MFLRELLYAGILLTFSPIQRLMAQGRDARNSRERLVGIYEKFTQIGMI
jgi:hypothetical protein